MYKMLEWRRESKIAEMYKQGEIRIFCEPLLLRSAFRRLVQGHLKALNHLCFSSLLYFHKSRQGHFKVPKHLRFSLLLYFRESGKSQAFLYHLTQDSLAQGQLNP